MQLHRLCILKCLKWSADLFFSSLLDHYFIMKHYILPLTVKTPSLWPSVPQPRLYSGLDSTSPLMPQCQFQRSLETSGANHAVCNCLRQSLAVACCAHGPLWSMICIKKLSLPKVWSSLSNHRSGSHWVRVAGGSAASLWDLAADRVRK